VDRALVGTGSLWSPHMSSKFFKKCFHVSDRGATSDFVMENGILYMFLYKDEGFKTSDILSFKLARCMYWKGRD
jgi:hypothetical protein